MTESAKTPDDHNATLRADASRTRRSYTKPMLLLGMIALAVLVLVSFGEYVQLQYLATKESELRDFQRQHPTLVYGIAFALYVMVTGLSLPGAAALTLVYGWYFGFLASLVLVSFASTTGASIAFLVSRFLLRDGVQSRLGDRLTSINRHLEQEGAFYLFSLRLIPLVPFFVINLAMGLTSIKARTFWWVSQLGMLPGTAVYVYAGSSVPNLSELASEGAAAVFSPAQLTRLFVAFALLGLFPLVVRRLLMLLTSTRPESDA